MQPTVKKSTFERMGVFLVFVSSIVDADRVKADQMQVEEYVGSIAR